MNWMCTFQNFELQNFPARLCVLKKTKIKQAKKSPNPKSTTWYGSCSLAFSLLLSELILCRLFQHNLNSCAYEGKLKRTRLQKSCSICGLEERDLLIYGEWFFTRAFALNWMECALQVLSVSENKSCFIMSFPIMQQRRLINGEQSDPADDGL